MAKDQNMIDALLRERAGYKRRGLDKRVSEVDEQLQHYGYDGDPDAADEPKGRTAPPKLTADGDAGPGAGKGPAKAPAKKTAAKKTAAATPPPPAAASDAPVTPAAE
jgi:hypothetical protein